MANSSVDILKQIMVDKGLSWPQFADYCGIIYGKLLGWLTRTYLPDQQTVRSVSSAVNFDETDMLARVAEDRRAVFAWATNIVSETGIGDVRTIRQMPGGRNFVFAVNEEWVLKVACDELGEAEQLLREQAISEFLARHQEIPAPELVGTGNAPTLWLLTHKVNGLPLERLWTNMAHEQKRDVCFQVGQLMASLHALPCEELCSLQHIPFYNSTTWAKIVTEGISEVLRSLHESAQYSEPQVKELERYIVAHENMLDFDFRPALLFGDHYDTHVCFVRHQGSYSIAGMFDFGSIIVGEPSWEFVYVNCSFLHQSPEYVAAFRKGYETTLPFPMLSLERLTLYTIWGNQGIDVWCADRESFDTSTSLVATVQEYWRHWL